MRWSWKLGEVAGIKIYMHATFLLLIGWVVLLYWAQGHGFAATLIGVMFILTLFLCVVLHELGHALTAKQYGISTRDITLLPIGGISRFERMPDKPRQELVVALAGPAVNVLIAALLFLWLQAVSGLEPLEKLSVTGGSFVERLLVVNILLVLFNMLPAFPMDGGRVLRALLAMRMNYVRATHIAAALGQGMALLFGFIGLLFNPFLIFIALFVWIGAVQETGMALIKSIFSGVPVDRAMLTDIHTLSPDDSLARPIELILRGSQHDFPVVEDGRVVGVLTHEDLLRALAEEKTEVSVREIMRRGFEVADSAQMLETAFAQLQSGVCRVLPVTHGGQLVGLITNDSVGEFIAVQTAMSHLKR